MIIKLNNDQSAPPFSRYGGKGSAAKWYLSYLPPHHTYVEPYCGSAALLFAKSRSKVEAINDLDSDIVNFFCVLRDRAQCATLFKLLKLTPYSREEFDRCKLDWENIVDPIERARNFYVRSRQSFGSVVGESWAYGKVSMKSFHNSLALFEPLCRRLEQVQIDHLPALDVINRYDSARTCFFADPPYLPETRVRQKGYQHEMTIDDHRLLLDQLKTVKGKVLLCGYPSTLYDDVLSGWRTAERVVAVATGAVDGCQPRRTEKIWMNFEDPRLVG